MEGELPAFRALQGGGNRDLYTKLVGHAGFSLPYALYLPGMQAVDFPAPLVLPLLQTPARQMQGLAADVQEIVLAGDLAGDVADGAAEIGPESAKRPSGALEVLGMSIALVPDQVELADPHIGLAKIETLAE
jgi:hypothetical protein